MTNNLKQIQFGDPDSFDAYLIEHQTNEENEQYISISDAFDDYVVLSSEEAIRKCIEALEETLHYGWLK